MTELLASQPHKGELQDCDATGKHLWLAMVAKGVDPTAIDIVADAGQVFELNIIHGRGASLMDGDTRVDLRTGKDTLADKGRTRVEEGTPAMLSALAVVATLGREL